jgi:hypothetical protein
MLGMRKCITPAILKEIVSVACHQPPPRDQKNSESRWRFRLPNPLTFRFRVRPSSSAST